MGKSIAERDWKYLRKIQPEMLSALCERINQQSMAILQAEYKRGDGVDLLTYLRADQEKLKGVIITNAEEEKPLFEERSPYI